MYQRTAGVQLALASVLISTVLMSSALHAQLSSANIRAVLISVDVTLNQAPLGANEYS
jgi:hypothetical protein